MEPTRQPIGQSPRTRATKDDTQAPLDHEQVDLELEGLESEASNGFYGEEYRLFAEGSIQDTLLKNLTYGCFCATMIFLLFFKSATGSLFWLSYFAHSVGMSIWAGLVVFHYQNSRLQMLSAEIRRRLQLLQEIKEKEQERLQFRYREAGLEGRELVEKIQLSLLQSGFGKEDQLASRWELYLQQQEHPTIQALLSSFGMLLSFTFVGSGAFTFAYIAGGQYGLINCHILGALGTCSGIMAALTLQLPASSPHIRLSFFLSTITFAGCYWSLIYGTLTDAF